MVDFKPPSENKSKGVRETLPSRMVLPCGMCKTVSCPCPMCSSNPYAFVEPTPLGKSPIAGEVGRST